MGGARLTRQIENGPEMRAKLNAALDQLAAALTENAGEPIGGPWVIVARCPANDGVAIFHHGIADADVPRVLTRAAEVRRDAEPDVEATS